MRVCEEWKRKRKIHFVLPGNYKTLFFRGEESHANIKDVDCVILADCIYYEEVRSFFIKFLLISVLIF